MGAEINQLDGANPDAPPVSGGQKFLNALKSPFVDMYGFFIYAKSQFGLSFLCLIGLVYFMQGFRDYVFRDAVQWFYRAHFELSPGQVQSYQSTILITWNIKMVYGLIFDNFPLFHRHSQPFLILASAIGVLGYIGLGIESMSNTPGSALGFFWCALMAMAMSDVIADAMVVKEARRAGAKGGASLQTFCWSMLYVGSIIGRPTSGSIAGEAGEGSRNLMLYVYTTSAGIVLLAAFFLFEDPTEVQWSVKRVVWQVWRLIKGVLFNFKVLLPMSYIVLSRAMTPSVNVAMSYWKQQEIDIGANLQSYIDTIADLFAICGLLIYARWFKATPFRKIFFFTGLFGSVLLLSDNVLFYRWNVSAKIPDVVFLLGSDSVATVLGSVASMPFLVMAAQLCPEELEATFYATLTSLSNAGSNASVRWGGFLLDKLGVVLNKTTRKYNFDNLGLALWIRFGLSLGSLLLVLLVPNVSALDPHNEREIAEAAAEAEAAAAAAAEEGKLDAKIDPVMQKTPSEIHHHHGHHEHNPAHGQVGHLHLAGEQIGAERTHNATDLPHGHTAPTAL